MKNEMYQVAAVMFFVLVVALTGLIFFALNYAMKRAGYEKIRKNKILSIAAIIFSGWMALLALLAMNGFFSDFTAVPPRILLTFIPTMAFVFYLLRSGSFAEILKQIPGSWLAGTQVMRVYVEIVLWILFLGNIIPEQMSFDGRNFDILVGLTAPLMVYFYYKKQVLPRWSAFAWNIAGIFLLLNIVITATLSAPTPFRVFMNEPANTLFTNVPFVWLPGFVVPLAFALHFFSMKKLLQPVPQTAVKSAVK